ncbi:MAG: nucleotidyltransferase domain-containing protein [Ilumatobacteraceae bacterium]
MSTPSEPTPDVATALGTYLDIVDSMDPALVEGLYVVGSYALDDWQPGASDIDVVVVTAEPATDEDYGTLRTVHALLAEQQPLPHVDGPYLAWGDLVVEPATGLHRPWTLDGQLHHDGDCFEISPITWYTLATYGVTVRGPAPDTLGIPVDTEARVRFVVDNLQTYWASVATDVQRACEAQPDRAFSGESFVWVALGALRLHHTAFTGDVTSKRGAGEYGLTVAPVEFHDAVHAALAMRADAERGEASSALMGSAAALVQWVVDDTTAAFDAR